jgi:hypothetical protein
MFRRRGAHMAPGYLAAAGLAALVALPSHVSAARLPEIRLSESNPVPACVTPQRLMTFLKTRNRSLDPRFKSIAYHYRDAGEAWRVRWDYAFFQMAIETNFLTYRAPNGRMGDVDPKQNNFAGIGTTGGGVPGNRFADVTTGVLAQIQHLVVYSGETIADPVAPRTALKQDEILGKSRALGRAVRFSDLSRRWAVDPKYGRSIEWVANKYRAKYCRSQAKPVIAEVLPWAKKKPIAAKSGLPPFRTIWSREEARVKARATETSAITKIASPPAPVPAKPPKPVTPVAATDLSPAQPAKPQQARVTPQAAGEPSTVSLFPAEPESGFALFSPPPGFGKLFSFIAPGSSDGETTVASKSKFDPSRTPPSGLGVKPPLCQFDRDSYGGKKAVLIRVPDPDKPRYIALTVLDGFEQTLTDSYIRARAPGGTVLGEFPDQDTALEKARVLCPGS